MRYSECIHGKTATVLRTERLTYGVHAAFVVAQSYKTRTGSGSGLKGTGTGADPDEVQQKSQEIIQDIKVRFWLFCSSCAFCSPSDSTCLHMVCTCAGNGGQQRGSPKSTRFKSMYLDRHCCSAAMLHNILACPVLQSLAAKHAPCCLGKVGRH